MSISSWIINLDMNSEESRLFCIVLQSQWYCFTYNRRGRKSSVCLSERLVTGVSKLRKRGEADVNFVQSVEPLTRLVI